MINLGFYEKIITSSSRSSVSTCLKYRRVCLHCSSTSSASRFRYTSRKKENNRSPYSACNVHYGWDNLYFSLFFFFFFFVPGGGATSGLSKRECFKTRWNVVICGLILYRRIIAGLPYIQPRGWSTRRSKRGKLRKHLRDLYRIKRSTHIM